MDYFVTDLADVSDSDLDRALGVEGHVQGRQGDEVILHFLREGGFVAETVDPVPDGEDEDGSTHRVSLLSPCPSGFGQWQAGEWVGYGEGGDSDPHGVPNPYSFAEVRVEVARRALNALALTASAALIPAGYARVRAMDDSLVAELPGNPLYTAEVVGVDLGTGTISWAGEQEAGSGLWNWLLSQGFSSAVPS